MESKQKAYQLFSSFKNRYYKDEVNESENHSSDQFDMDDNMKHLILKINKHSKKSSATRIKALRQTTELLSTKSEDYFDSFLKIFTIIYEKILTCEDDSKVLLELHKCMGKVIERAGSIIRKNFPQIFHYIYFATFEPKTELSCVCKDNMSLILKHEDKIARSIYLFRDRLFGFIRSILSNGAEFLSNMSIYDDKEVNQLIYKKLVSMSWWAMADIINKLKSLSPDEEAIVMLKVNELAFSSESPLSLTMFNSCVDDYVLKTAILYFWNLVISGKGLVDKILLKKIVQTILLTNLDDPNNSFQEILWRNRFIFKLFELGKLYNVNKEILESKFLSLVENHCYGIGETFYSSLENCIKLFVRDETQTKGELLIKKILVAHFKSVLKDDLKFDIVSHYKVGFRIIKNLLVIRTKTDDGKKDSDNKKLKSKFEFLPIGFIVSEILEQSYQMFLENNNHLQKNLNAISINLIKYFPSEFSEFLFDIEQSEFEEKSLFLDLTLKMITKFSNLLFETQLKDQKKILNTGLIMKYCVFKLEKSTEWENKSSIISRIVGDSLIICINTLKNSLNSVNGYNFDETIVKLTNIYGYLKEISEKGLGHLYEILSKAEPKIIQNFNDFVFFLETSFCENIVNQKIKAMLFDQAQIDCFVQYFADFIKLFSFKIIFEEIIIQLDEYCSNYVIEIASKNQWKKILHILLEKEILQSFGSQFPDFNEDFIDFAGKLSKISSTKSNDFALVISKSHKFWKLYSNLVDLAYKRNIHQIILPILAYFKIDSHTAGQILITYLFEYYEKKKSSELNSNELFKICITFDVLKDVETEKFKQLTQVIIDYFRSLESAQLEKLKNMIPEIFNFLGKRAYIEFYKQLIQNLIPLSNIQLKDINLFKDLSKFMNKQMEEGGKTVLSDFISQELFQYFTTYSQKNTWTTDIFRLINKHVNELNFKDLIERLIFRLQDGVEMRSFLVNLISQPSLIHNFSSIKQRQFWNDIIYGSVLPIFTNFYDKNYEFFQTLFFGLLKQVFDNFNITVFIKKALKQIFNDETGAPESKTRLFIDLTQHFDLLFKNPSILQETLFFYKSLFATLPLQLFWKEEALLNRLREEKVKLKQTLDVIFCLRSNLIKIATPEIDFLEINDIQLDISVCGKLLHAQIECLKLELENPKVRVFALSLILEYINYAIENHEESVLAANSMLLEGYLIEVLKMAEGNFNIKFSQNCFHTFLVILQRLINVLEMFSESFENEILKKISIYSFKFSLGIKNRTFINGNLWTISPEEFFNEIAETISRFAIREVTKISIDELFELLEIDINSIKRISFFLLQQFKKPFNISKLEIEKYKDHEKVVAMLMNHFPQKLVDLINGGEGDDDLTYFIKWAYILQMCDGQNEEALLNFQVIGRIFAEERKLYNLLMNRILTIFAKKNLNNSQLERLIDNLDFVNPEKIWGEFVTDEIEESFSLNVLYNLTYLFPRNLRNWLMDEKKYSSLAKVILKHNINEKIYNKELDKIELTQHQWKSDDFNVFFNRNTKEIFAIYIKDDVKFEIVLNIPSNYPEKSISIKILDKTKISAEKEMTWKQLISRALANHNKNIIDALIFWKENMDKVFNGIEPCFICYCVLHPTSHDIPKMSCNTCKKLLHSDCIKKWFVSSQKSDCPLCKSKFL